MNEWGISKVNIELCKLRLSQISWVIISSAERQQTALVSSYRSCGSTIHTGRARDAPVNIGSRLAIGLNGIYARIIVNIIIIFEFSISYTKGWAWCRWRRGVLSCLLLIVAFNLYPVSSVYATNHSHYSGNLFIVIVGGVTFFANLILQPLSAELS